MKKLYLLTISVLALASCTSVPDYDEDEMAYPTLTKEQIQQNVQEVFGTTFDSNHDWSSLNTHTVSITANANLNDVVKVQILTESPFMNEDATVLNEVAAAKGQTVELKYDAPADFESLVAACYDSNGKCYIQSFTPGQEKVSFASTNRARTRGTTDLPDASKIVLNSKTKSINAQRAEAKWGVWAEASGQQWLNDYLWEPKNGSLGGSWNIELGSIYRDLPSKLTTEEEQNIRAICNQYLYKIGKDTNGKKNNLKSIRKSPFFSMENNYLTTMVCLPICS